MTNKDKCILGSGVCNLAGDSKHCNNLCSTFIQLHGSSAKGGRIGLGNTPKEYRLLTTKNSFIREEQPNAYAIIDKYIVRLFEPRNQKEERFSLYLYSENTGTGKSSTASAILNTYIIKDYLKALRNQETPTYRPAYFLDCNEWQTLYNQATRPNVPKDVSENAWEEYYRMKDISESVPFLVMDDVAVRSITEGHRGDLHSLINHRITEGLPTVYTSNVPIVGLPEVFGENRLFDRLRDMCLELEFKGESKRGIKNG